MDTPKHFLLNNLLNNNDFYKALLTSYDKELKNKEINSSKKKESQLNNILSEAEVNIKNYNNDNINNINNNNNNKKSYNINIIDKESDKDNHNNLNPNFSNKGEYKNQNQNHNKNKNQNQSEIKSKDLFAKDILGINNDYINEEFNK